MVDLFFIFLFTAWLSKQTDFRANEKHFENHTFFVIKHYVWVAVHSISKIARDSSTVSVEKWDIPTSDADPDPFDSDPDLACLYYMDPDPTSLIRTLLVSLVWIRIRLL